MLTTGWARAYAIVKRQGTVEELRAVYEAAPMSFIVEQAGGRSTTGAEPIMAIVPDHVHQRVPVFLGSRDDVADLEATYARHNGTP